MRSGEGESALEQAWLLHELNRRFQMSLEELSRRFGRSTSWVSRRLALVQELPEEIQEKVRHGGLSAHAAMRFLVPLARANREGCLRLADQISGRGLSSRQVGALYAAWRDGIPETQEKVLDDPLLFLRVRQAEQRDELSDGCRSLLRDLDVVAAVARRVMRRMGEGVMGHLLPPEQEEVKRALAVAHEVLARFERVAKEVDDAERSRPRDDLAAASAGP